MNIQSPGTHLNRLMDSLGFPDKLGDVMGAALDARIGHSAGVARNLLDAFSPLSTKQLDQLMSGGIAQAGHCPPPGTHYGLLYTSRMLARMQQQNLNGAIQNLAHHLPGIFLQPGMSPEEQLGTILQDFVAKREKAIQTKLQQISGEPAVAAPAAGKRRKKKGGIGKKLAKGFKKIGKGIGKLAKGVMKAGKGLFKGVINSVVKGPLNLLKGVLSGKLGNLFQLGSGLLGGLVGGPVGSFLIGQIAQKGRLPRPGELVKGMAQQLDPRRAIAARFQDVFGQVHSMFGVLNKIQQGISDVQRGSLSLKIRV